jgi:hypothetical protein
LTAGFQESSYLFYISTHQHLQKTLHVGRIPIQRGQQNATQEIKIIFSALPGGLYKQGGDLKENIVAGGIFGIEVLVGGGLEGSGSYVFEEKFCEFELISRPTSHKLPKDHPTFLLALGTD